jgi:membrane fusion protein, copper/silver efflux system
MMTAETIPNPSLAPRKKSALIIIIIAVLAALAGAIGFFIARGPDESAAPAVAEKKQLYQCPMHPSVVMDHPGECPICGMKLVPMQSETSTDQAEHGRHDEHRMQDLAMVHIDPARQQMIGLTTVQAELGPIGGAWRTTGRVAIDETRVRHVNVKVPGFVEQIYVDFVGKPVKRGEPLFSIYSPDLLAAQEELLLALRTQERLRSAGGLANDGEALVQAAYRKLELWDIPRSEIDRLMATRKPLKAVALYSPIAGVVTKKDVVQGMRLDAGAMPYEITDLSQVWVLADVYESELRHVKVGMAAELTLRAFPGRTFQGRVAFLDPILDPATRTAKVRLIFPNATGELRPEMFGEVILRGVPRQALRIPVDAVIHSGTESYLFASLGEGKFEPRKVELGEQDGQVVEVTSGIDAGERVIGRANFLVDSESRLRASLDAMRSGGHEGHGR